ncbi:MAG: PIG-L family deacetylase, partial [Myxococcota bacterium]|nr:PIG-L family deacetylase [Myxococcota bacterium]
MRAAVIVLLLVAAGCGDNAYPRGAPLARSADVTIVAHQDDDLLFMQPDLFEAVQGGTGITNVYVTAGNARGGVLQAEQRERGLMRAYAGIAGSDDWFCGTLALAGHTALHCRLDAAQVSLVFLGYPDGGKQGEEPDSLTRLWNGEVERATTIARDVTTYDRAGLIAAVAAVLDETRPALIRTLEVASTHGRDHADHLITGALAVAATAASQVNPALLAYRGYNTGYEPANVIEPLFDRSAEILARYRGCPGDCSPISDAHDTWLHRRYAVAMRRPASGTLRPALGEGCVIIDHIGGLALGDCATAPTWSLVADGTLHVTDGTADRCLVLQAGELITTSTCTASIDRRFFLDDDGHLFAGAPPAFGALAGQHLQCLVVDGGRPRAGTCGSGSATTW